MTWSIASGADVSKFAISSTGALSFVQAPDFESPTDNGTNNTYEVAVVATDAAGNASTQTVTITVTNVNEAPTDIALSASSVAENAATGTTVGTLSATDVDAGDTFTYTLVSGTGDTDNASFTIDGNTLKTAAVFDYETKSSYSVRVRVTDAGGLTFEKVFTITVTDLDEVSPVITGPGSSTGLTSAISVAENTTAVHTFTASETVTWSIASGADVSKFAISSTGALSFVQAPDFESPTDNGTNNTYEVAVVATDAAGNASTQTVTITVTNVNEAPTDIALSATSVAENVAANSTIGSLSTTDVDAGDTFTYTLVSGTGDTDNAAFTITGADLTINSIPNFEAKSSYTVRIKTTDQGGLSFEKAFTISVTNVNEAPTDIALSSSNVAENAATGTAVGALSATDVDAGDTHTYTLVSGSGDTDNASFTIDGNTLKTSSVFNYEAYSNTYSIRVRVTDAGGLTFEKEFTISVTNVNEAPTNIALSPSSISESLPSGTTVGSLASIDVDAGDTFTYTLVSGTGDTDNASFTIDGNTLKTAAVFDYETKSSYSVRVRVTDAGGLTFEKVFTITVTDLDEVSPVITGPGSSTGLTSAISVAENTDSCSYVYSQ